MGSRRHSPHHREGLCAHCHKMRTESSQREPGLPGEGMHCDRLHRAGCLVLEINDHVIQTCHRTHGVRFNRSSDTTPWQVTYVAISDARTSQRRRAPLPNDGRTPKSVHRSHYGINHIGNCRPGCRSTFGIRADPIREDGEIWANMLTISWELTRTTGATNVFRQQAVLSWGGFGAKCQQRIF